MGVLKALRVKKTKEFITSSDSNFKLYKSGNPLRFFPNQDMKSIKSQYTNMNFKWDEVELIDIRVYVIVDPENTTPYTQVIEVIEINILQRIFKWIKSIFR